MRTNQTSRTRQSKPTTRWYLVGVTVLLILSVGLTGCIVNVGTSRATETVSNSFTTSSQPTIIVGTFNGKINVRVGSSSQVEVNVIKTGSGFSQANAEADLQNIAVEMTQNGDTIRVTAERTSNTPVSNSGAEVDLTVPAASILDLATSNGEIITSGVSGDLELTTSNGKLTVSGGQGLQNLTTSNGSIHVEAQSASVNAHTSNGSITFAGSLEDGNHSFETSNGSIEIGLPEDSQFEIDASTSNGRVSTEFPMTISGTSRDNELRGDVGGNPSVSITARSSNGSIKFVKSQ